MKKLYFSLILCFALLQSFAQVNGDYRSTGNGDWTAAGSWQVRTAGLWLPATTYPGNNAGTYNVYVQTGHTITITTNLTTANFGDLNIDGNVNLNIPGNPDVVNLNTTAINIDAGNLNFTGVKVRMNLPSSSIITLDNGGTITADTCNNNNEIFIGTRRYATCAGGGSSTYTFGEVSASGGVINAEITTPASGPVTAQACTSQSLVGGYSGTETNVTFNWYVREPGATTNTLLSTGTLANDTVTTSESFAPNLFGSYLITLEITTASFTNIETRTFNSDDTQAPTPDLASLPIVNGQCSASVSAPTATDNCAGAITGTTSDPTSYSAQG
ncbi:hypothetical protein, partial [Winogradskyella sp. A3E31]|uniref:hypothetical protein n=1 Tax=Winogradskyella sp. A3E31 TaxID=3349637 RepID=UPI00398B7255